MPGLSSIVWNDANDARLLQALVVAQDTVPDAALAQQIADLMGCGVTSGAIKHRIKTHKSKGRANGISAGTPSTPKKSNGISKQTLTPRRYKTSPAKASHTKQKRQTKITDPDDSDAESMASGDDDIVADANGCTPKSTRARRSMAAAAKKIDYAKLDGPHADEVSDDEKVTKREREEDSESDKQHSAKVPRLTETVESEFDVGF